LRAPELDFLDTDKDDMFRHVWLMFKHSGTVEAYNISEQKFYSLLSEVQRLYDHRSNPFHNFKHGVSVLHSTYYLLRYTKASEAFDKLGVAAMLFAALMHDVDHTGRTNVFEMNSWSDLGTRYNDVSILENHHCATAFSLIKQEKYNIFSSFSYEQKTKFRKVAIQAILCTDVKLHFSHLEKFKDKLDQNSFKPYPNENEQDFLLLVGQIVHTSDLYVPTKKVDAAIRWSRLVNQEFINQNLEEKTSGLPETPFYKNLDKPEVMSKSEKFFVEKLVTPLWVELDRFCEGALEVQLSNLKQNLAYWEGEVKRLEDLKPAPPQ
jgi:cAMP-specific phosphodiesterase 4